jgi:hypothetical protein
VFLLNTDRLHVGDIILTSDKTLRSKGIRALTRGDFSHVMLYVADHSYIHSDGSGVHAGNTQRRLFGSAAGAVVLRLRDFDEATAERACAFARSEVGKQYSRMEAARSKSRREAPDQLEDSNRQFCSRLVAQAYAFAGTSLVSNPNYCYPSDFLDSPQLRTVETPLRHANSAEIEFARSESPLEMQTRATNFILSEVRKLSGMDIQTFEQLPGLLFKSPQHDRAVCEIVKASGYLELWKEDVRRNPWRYDVEQFASLPHSPSELVRAARLELLGAARQMEQFKMAHGQARRPVQRDPGRLFPVGSDQAQGAGADEDHDKWLSPSSLPTAANGERARPPWPTSGTS